MMVCQVLEKSQADLSGLALLHSANPSRTLQSFGSSSSLARDTIISRRRRCECCTPSRGQQETTFDVWPPDVTLVCFSWKSLPKDHPLTIASASGIHVVVSRTTHRTAR
jgi:hypothetical protein